VPQERSEAVVLRGVDFSETSRIVTFLTPERGKLACMAAGGKRPKSPFAGVLDTFNELEIVYYWRDSRTVQRLAETTLLDGFPGLKRDLDKTLLAAFPLEIAYKAAQENEPSAELYACLVNGLRAMARWTGPPHLHAAWQVLRLLAAAGYEPELEVRGAAGRAAFSNAQGVTSASGPGVRSITSDELAALQALGRARGTCPVLEQFGRVFELLRGFAAHQLETEFRSLRVLDQMARTRS
jgi:DNA repair protein RecO (recombination protein O)